MQFPKEVDHIILKLGLQPLFIALIFKGNFSTFSFFAAAFWNVFVVGFAKALLSPFSFSVKLQGLEKENSS